MGFYGDEIFAESYMTYMISTPLTIKLSIPNDIKNIKKKLESIDSKEEKIAYLNKTKTNAKKGLTYRQNQLKTQMAKDSVAKSYQKLFDFIDSELEKLK